mgnify:CR=1 FL=1
MVSYKDLGLVNTREMFAKAIKGGYAVPAFNFNNMEQLQAIIQAAAETKSPVILQVSKGARNYANQTLLRYMAEGAVEYAKELGWAKPQIVLHLDHGDSFELCKSCVDMGFSSVMIDGSALPYDENVALTKKVVEYAHQFDVTVEGELGVLAGVEDHVFSAGSTYTNPLDAVEFIKKTKVDALAISYGTMHGANKGKGAKLRKEIAIATKECLLHEGIFCALVSHGSSTVPQYIVKEINDLGGDIQNAYGIELAQLKEAASCGIAKINVDTDIRLAVTRNMKELFYNRPELRESPSIGGIYKLLEEKKSAFDPRAFLPPIMDTVMYGNVPDADVAAIVDCIEKGVREVIGTLIVEFGSVGKAPLVEKVTLDEMAERYRKEGI